MGRFVIEELAKRAFVARVYTARGPYCLGKAYEPQAGKGLRHSPTGGTRICCAGLQPGIRS